MIKDEGEEQIKALEEDGKQLFKNSDEKEYSTFKTKQNYRRTC